MLLNRKPVLFGLIGAILFPSFAFASIGVGVGIGEINLDKPIQPGGIYQLPSLPVINTGTEPSEYQVSIQYHYKQPELLPPLEWFHFDPDGFYLEPGEVQRVKISLVVPVRTEPGDYFAYVEGRGVTEKDAGGGAKIGVAAAAKLYFTVLPASGWEGFRFRVLTLYKKYSPWPQVIFGIVSVTLILFVLSRFVSLNLKTNRTKKKE